MRMPQYVEVETSRYCNRLCEWCPNHELGDRKEQELLPWEVLERVARSLARADYAGWFAFHNYNEPLANPRIVDEVALIKALLPAARPPIFTNGDRLTEELFGALVDAGLKQMRITLYPKKRTDTLPSHQPLWNWLDRRSFLQRKGWEEADVRQGAALVHNRDIDIIMINPRIEGYYDRGGTIPWLSVERTAPCHLTAHSLSIDYRGDIKMCCNVVTGAKAHKRYMLGNVGDADVLELWNSPSFEAIRALHERADWTRTPICATCRQEIKAAVHGA